MEPKKRKILMGLTLLILGFLTHFIFIGRPSQVVFDEVHYGKFANGYLNGEYFFSGHPPLGPQLITLGAWLGGYEPHFKFETIGEKYADNSYISLRLLPYIAGALIPLVIFIFLLTLGFSGVLAFAAGIMLVLDNAILAQSRFILTDAFLILFGFLGLALFFYSRKKNYDLKCLLLAGIFFGMSFSVKWSGLSFLILTGAVSLFDLAFGFFKKTKANEINILKLFFAFVVLPSLVYAGVFYLHFKLLPKPGPGSVFMSQEFNKGQLSFARKFIEMNVVSYYSNVKNLTSPHEYSSKFYTWPIMERPVYYWVDGSARIYLLGNPVIWWGSSISVIFLIIYILAKRFKNATALILLLGYLVNLLPFFGVKRVLFQYHYLSALIFGVIIMVCLISKLKYSKVIFLVLLAAAFLAFVYFSPLTYGFNLTPEQYENRVWFETWR